MKAILRDQKGWTKIMTIPYAMREIRLPLHRKLRNIWDFKEGSAISRDRVTEVVVFELTQRGLNDDTYYYDEVVYGGASGNANSPFDESHDGANPSTASSQLREEK